MFTRAVVRAPAADLGQGLTTALLGAPDCALALAQHAAYVAALERLGLSVERLAPLPGFPDAWFVEDAAVIVPELAVVARPGADTRRGEVAAMAKVLAPHRPLATIEAPGTLEGGDVLVVGREVFIGLSERTNAGGAEQLARLLSPHGYRSVLVPVGAGLHLKSSLTSVGGETLLVTEALAGRPELAGHAQLVVDAAEEYAANSLLVNGTLLTPAGFPRTRRQLERTRLPILELDTSEARKMDGGLTCMSLRF
jgi:dimethylargininase